MLELLNSPCGANVKAQQAGEPLGGYRNSMGGLIAANMSCNVCLDWDWFRNSESVSKSLYFVAHLFMTSPGLRETVGALAQDDMCHFKKSLQAILRRLRAQRGDAPDTPAMELYDWLLSRALVVDEFHFKCHSEDDEYCQRETNPTLERLPVGLEGEQTVVLQELLEFEDSESSEQLFRWLGRANHIINSESLSSATFYVHRLVWEHNERQVLETCMDKMVVHEVRRTRAAYGLPAVPAIGPSERAELAELLLSSVREYDLECAEFKAWKATYEVEFMERQRARQAAASERRAKARARKAWKKEQKAAAASVAKK